MRTTDESTDRGGIIGNCVVTIIVVNFNAGQLLTECIASVKQFADVDFEAIVVDNASSDGSVDALIGAFGGAPWLRIIESCQNVGFAAANNLALKSARGTIVHFLNPDALFFESMAPLYRNALATPPCTIGATRILNSNGTEARSLQRFPFLSTYIQRDRDSRPKYWALGASVVAHREALINAGGWPEDYFMYAEDLDLFYSLQSNGWTLRLFDQAVIHASKGITKNVWTDQERQLRVENSGIRFAKKYNRMADFAVLRALAIGRKFVRGPAQAVMEARAFIAALRGRVP